MIFFTGWSTNSGILRDVYIPPGYDLLCCWDYRELSWQETEKNYNEIVVIAWSFGVAAANILLPLIEVVGNVTGRYAINGSRIPIDDHIGIPKLIFEGTMNSLDVRNLQKFRIRIAGGIARYKHFEKCLESELSIEELREELIIFNERNFLTKDSSHWDYVFISENDKIFPASNLENSWKDTPFSILPREEHLPDFRKLFNLILKDKLSIGKNFEKSLLSYNISASVQNQSCIRLMEILQEKGSSFKDILEIGSGSGNLTHLIKTSFLPRKLTVMDITGIPPLSGVDFIRGDAEILVKNLPSGSYDLVISGSTMQWFHSPGGMMKEIKRTLKNDGIFAFSTFISGTFKELSALSGDSLLYLTEQQWKDLANKMGYQILYSEVLQTVLTFDSVKEVFDHLKTTGVNSLSGGGKSVGEMRKIINSYPIKDGKRNLTYLSFIMILRKNG